MKNKIIYLFILIFAISFLSSAKKLNGTCDKVTSCSQQSIQQCSDKEAETNDETEVTTPSLGLFLINI